MNLGNRASRLVLPLHQDGLLRWLARLVSKRIVSLALIAAIVTADHTIPWHGMSFVPRALIDEPCAIATALVVLGAITRFRGKGCRPGAVLVVCPGAPRYRRDAAGTSSPEAFVTGIR